MRVGPDAMRPDGAENVVRVLYPIEATRARGECCCAASAVCARRLRRDDDRARQRDAGGGRGAHTRVRWVHGGFRGDNHHGGCCGALLAALRCDPACGLSTLATSREAACAGAAPQTIAAASHTSTFVAEHALETQPLLTNIANTAVLFAIGDTISQVTSEHKPGQGWNFLALARAIIYGGVIYCIPCVSAPKTASVACRAARSLLTP